MLPEGVRPWYQEWRDEGRQEGVQEGLQKGLRKGRQEGVREGKREGRREGEAAVLERLLRRQFGKLPAEVHGRLQKARSKELLRWAERCLTARTLDDVFSE